MSFICNICNKTLTQSGSLNRHIRSIHLKTEQYICIHCGKSFNRNHHLKEHLKFVCGTQKRVSMKCICNICNKCFTQNSSLLQHVRDVHKNIKNFKCQLCDLTFSRNSSLKCHIESVHKKLKDFNCNICNKSFAMKQQLEIHIKTIHDKVKDFICNMCDKSFSIKQNLKSHINLIHENPKPSNMSRPEKIIHDILKDLNISFKQEVKFKDLLGIGRRQLRFDFGIQLETSYLFIEYDGSTHFKPTIFGNMTIDEAINALKIQKVHDNLKNDYCLINEYKLLRLTAKDLPSIRYIIIQFIKDYSNILDNINII